MHPNSVADRLSQWARKSIGLKLVMMGFLTLVLLIPAAMIQSTVRERLLRRESAIADIDSKWGVDQIVGGPWLVIPYKTFSQNNKGERFTTMHWATFLPETLQVTGKADTQVRHRGIYDAVLYEGDLHFSGTFAAPDFTAWSVPPENIDWKEAALAFAVSDMRGLRSNLVLKWNGREHAMEPGITGGLRLDSGASVRIPQTPGPGPRQFSLDIKVNGSQKLQFLPLGKTTTIHLESPWSSPSFTGAYLPTKHRISPQGFSADWDVLQLNRNYPQAWTEPSVDVQSSAFGVELLIPADQYQMTTRSLKYSVLFILLTFGALFFIELRLGKPVHVLQYLLIGLALVLFYSLLLSLAEHMGFNAAYGVSSLAIIGMVSLYAKGIFQQPRVTLGVAALISILYLYLFVILQIEDYALLIGNAGLLVALSLSMYLTRQIQRTIP